MRNKIALYYLNKTESSKTLPNRAEHSLHYRYADRGPEVGRPRGEKSKMHPWENFGHKLDSSYWQVIIVFRQTIRSPCDATSYSTLLHPPKVKSVSYSARKRRSLENGEVSGSLEFSHSHSIRHTRCVFEEENTITRTDDFLAVKKLMAADCN